MQNSLTINGSKIICSAKEVFDIEANSVLKLKDRLNDNFQPKYVYIIFYTLCVATFVK